MAMQGVTYYYEKEVTQRDNKSIITCIAREMDG